MDEKLFLQFQQTQEVGPESEDVQWFYVSDNQIIESGCKTVDQLSDLTSEFSAPPVIVLVPSSDCLVTRVSIPTRQRRQQIKAVPYAIEEQLAEDIEDIHFAIGQRDTEQNLPVIAVSKSKMGNWLSVLNEAGVSATAILPVSALLEAPEDTWSIFQQDDLFIVNQNGECWCANAHEAMILLQLSIDDIAEDELPAILFWGTSAVPGWITGLGLEVSEQVVHNAQQALLARHEQQSINLLQGEFEIQDDWKAAWSIWRRVAVFVVLAVLLKFTLMGFQLYNLSSDKEYFKQEITRVYQEVAPGARMSAYPKRQMQQLLARHQGVGNQSTSFLFMLSQVGESLASTPGSKPTNINYDNSRGEIRIDLLVSSLPLLDQLKDKLAAKGLSIEVGGASAQGNDYSGRLIIRSGS